MGVRLSRSLVAGVLVSVAMLASCAVSPSHLPGGFWSSDEATANAVIARVSDALASHDKPAMMALFSEAGRSQANDLGTQVDTLFDFVQGTVLSHQLDPNGGPDSREYNDGPMRWKELSIFFTITTDVGTYSFFMADRVVDDFHEYKVGVYTLRAMRIEDEEKYMIFSEAMRIPGIWCPPGA